MLRNDQRGIANLPLKESHLKVTMDTRQALMSQGVADEPAVSESEEAGSHASHAGPATAWSMAGSILGAAIYWPFSRSSAEVPAWSMA